MTKLRELFDHVDRLNKNSRYKILVYAEVLAYDDEGYGYNEGDRDQTPYELMQDYLNGWESPSIEGFTEWSRSQKVYCISKNYDRYMVPEEGEELEWDEDDPFLEKTLYEALNEDK